MSTSKPTPPDASGLIWRKLDLHVHTPASSDFDRPDLTPEEFVDAATKAGVEAIAITDHNTGAWIDRVKEAASGKLVIFPGVEITATGGKSGSIHVLALFDTDATTKTVENLLGALGIRDEQYGAPGAHTTKSPYEVIDAIADRGGLAILAHADSSKGVLHDMKGEPRSGVMNHPKLAAVEVHDFPKYFRMLDGTDCNYRRKLAVYCASDNRSPDRSDCHSAKAIGSRYTWFKMDGISLESLRQCFCDREVRIRPAVEATRGEELAYPRILRVDVMDGFLKGQTANFHEGLNSIIGGKGVGKSLLIECLRFALGQTSSVPPIQKDTTGKLASRLGVGGTVRVVIRLATGQTLVVERMYDGDENPVRLTDAGTNEPLEADVTELFRILAYSQTEALEIARDGAAQLALIDTFVETADVQHRRATLVAALKDSDRQLAQALRASAGAAAPREELKTVDAQLAHITSALQSPRFDQLAKLQPKTDCIEDLKRFATSMEQACDKFTRALEACDPSEVPEAYAEDADLRDMVTNAERLAREARNAAQQIRSGMKVFAEALGEVESTWARHVQQETEAFRRWTAEAGGDKPQLHAKHQQLTRRRAALIEELEGLEEKAAQAEELRTKRDRLLDEMAALDDELAARRQAEYEAIAAASGGRLELVLERGANRADYLRALLDCKRGSRLQQKHIEQVVEQVSPRRLVKLALAGNMDELAREAGLDRHAADRLVASLLDLDDLGDLLSLEHAGLPKDVPHIRFRKEDGKYYELADLSVGQKCTALLIIALARGSMPVIIDQPEDALDVRSIYEDVTQQLRGRKDGRQFILTTHNATVAVAADTDKFHVLHGDAASGAVLIGGAIDRREVRDEVIRHLEGGHESFELKRRKYGITVG